jgi:uncharacterized protein (TIGR04255 family)
MPPNPQDDQAPDKQYLRPPITEAVVELRFEPSIPAGVLKKLSSRFAKSYPGVQELKNISVKLEIKEQPEPIVDPGRAFYRRASPDETQLAIISEQSLAISQLAPYPGWREFLARFARDLAIWRDAAGFRRFTRIGLRYINRIDIPMHHLQKIDYEAFLRIYPHLPFDGIYNYAMNVQLPIENIPCDLTINTATVQPPLYGFGSHLLDLDFGRTIDVPQGIDEIIDFLSILRLRKNEVFEACVTDKARALFRGEATNAS